MDHILTLSFLATTLGATWRLATPIIFASVGEVISERAGVLNIGLEGTMLLGAFTGFATVYATGNLPLGFLAAGAAGALAGLLFALFAITIKANQIIVGAALNLLGLGLTSFLFRTYLVQTGQGVQIVPAMDVPLLSQIPYFGTPLFRQNIVVYSTILVALGAYFLLFRTSFGLTLRAVGEHPKAVDVGGRSVALYRYAAVLIGCSLAGLGGAYLTLAHANQFVEGMTSGRGFIALAVVVFARWSPIGAFFVSLLFGMFYALQLQLQAEPSIHIPYQVLQAMPYLATIVALLLVRNRTDTPATLGVPYRKV
ncbi:ABC transporter permease [Mesorhizobium sp. B2-3-11]|uniref:ABC transporter permease n=1 Tax=Mesorhizobium sp. B2-3-11 TaxID=2589953 RepID=UPI00112ABBD1|nr:ABC transporter permease [Mesorhizobium sp. B2-3-11]TPM07056.1 ABC transporter permease [Mesorhizobium sp. B2-3-11]